MPRGNRMGPAGEGPMTGRGAGYCGWFGMPGYASAGFVRGGFGRGHGGRGQRNMFRATGLTGRQRAAGVEQTVPPVEAAPDRTGELEILKRQAKYLADTLEQITNRIDQLRAEQPSEE